MGSGLYHATGGNLYIYIYFMLFFFIGVTFCLLSLTSIFIGSVVLVKSNQEGSNQCSIPMLDLNSNDADIARRSNQEIYKISLKTSQAVRIFDSIDSLPVKITFE